MEPFREDLSSFEPLLDSGWVSVLRGRTPGTGPPLLIKITRDSSLESRELLRREYEFSTQLDPDLIVQGREWFAEPVAGYTMTDVGFRPIDAASMQLTSVGAVLESGLRIARILATLHREGILHGCLAIPAVWKSSSSGEVRLSSFCYSLDGRLGSEKAPWEKAHAEDRFFMSPEQNGRFRRRVDHRSDLYSLGVFLYRGLSGRHPFVTEDLSRFVLAQLAESPAPLEELNGAVPYTAAAVVAKLLSKEPDDRYQSAQSVVDDLGACLEQWQTGRIDENFRVAATDVTPQFKLPQKVYGRRSELEVLARAVERARWGGKELVLVKGPSGIGKSTLINELRETIRDSGDLLLSGKYDQYSQTVPYSGVVEAFEELVRHLLSEGSEAREQWRTRILSAVGDNLRVVTEIIPDVAVITGKGDEIAALGPEERRNRLNRTFSEFVRVFAEAQQPLILALDDLQWADAASISLVSAMLRHPGTSFLTVIAIFRDDEVGATHPLNNLFADPGQLGITRTEAHLGPLHFDQVSRLVADTLQTDVDRIRPLASLIHGRTDGNPLHVRQVLEALENEELLYFDRRRRRWLWNDVGVSERMLTSGALELMANRVERLSANAKTAIQSAACLGSWFGLDSLATTVDLPLGELRLAIEEVLTAGLWKSRGAEADDSSAIRYAFTHDRVQNAAFALIPSSSLADFRFAIGRSLMRAGSPDVYVVATNINFGREDPVPGDERIAIAELNLRAAKTARTHLAYDDGVEFLRRGMEWLPAVETPGVYRLELELHAERFEAEYLTGSVELAYSLFDSAVALARTREELANLYYTRIVLETGSGRAAEAIASARTALRLYDADIPNNPSSVRILWEIAKSRMFLRFRAVPALIHMPEMTDDDKRVVIRLLMSMAPAAYFTDPNCLILSAVKGVNISLRYGNSPASGYGYVIYAMALGSQFSRYEESQQFGELAVATTRELGSGSLYCKVLLIFAGFVNFWSRTYEDSIQLLEESLQESLSVGDLQYANYSILQIVFLNAARGMPLPELQELIARHEPFVRTTNDAFAIDALRLRQGTLDLLAGAREPPGGGAAPLSGVSLLDPKNVATVSYRNVLNLQLAVYFGQVEQARQLGEISEQGIVGSISQIVVAEHYLFFGLVAARYQAERPGSWRFARRVVSKALRKLEMWAKHCPRNFAAMSLLLRAEAVAAGTRRAGAIDLFDRAIAAARRDGLVQVEALAHRLAADFHRRMGRSTVAAVYQASADRLFESWGALALVQATGRTLSEPVAGRSDAADFIAAKRATRTIFGETDLTRLIPSALDVIIECARAGRGVYLSRDAAGQIWLDAEGRAESPSSTLDPRERLELSQRVCAPIVKRVARTSTPLALSDVRLDQHYARHPYLRDGTIKSLACIPVVREDRQLGMFYLENDLAGVFTDDRIELVQLVSSEAAFALDHARLYNQQIEANRALQSSLRRVELLERAKEHLQKFVPQSVHRIIDENPDAPAFLKRERDISILFLDIVGYTQLGESLDPQSLDDLIEKYFSSYLEDIYANDGDINETSGDGLMILYQNANPSEHAEQAVRTAVAMQRSTRRINSGFATSRPPIELKVAINSGVASVGSAKFESGLDFRYTYTASGSVINIAARIAGMTPGGAILVSDGTYRRCADRYSFKDLGDHELRNVSKAVHVWELVWEEAR